MVVVYQHLPLYFSEPHRYPFLVRRGDRLVGFVLVKKGSEVSGNQAVWDMAEFFVLRGCRRRGIGTQIAREVWTRFPDRGKFASCNQMSRRPIFGSVLSQVLQVRRSFPFALKRMASLGCCSRLHPSASVNANWSALVGGQMQHFSVSF